MRRISLLLFTAILLLNGPPVYGATTAELQAQIALLLQQVQALQAQLQGSSTSIVLTFTLRRGSTDAATNGEVTKLQQFLARDKTIYPEALVTGYFGTKTEAAVKRFQTQNGIASIGIVGPQTREAIKRVSAPPAVTSVTVTTTPAPASTSTAVTTTTPVAPAPSVSDLGGIAVSPSSGRVGDAITITGSNFDSASNTVHFGDAKLTGIKSIGGNQIITFTLPGVTESKSIFPGTHTVYVSNSKGQTATTTFSVISSTVYPSIFSVSPNFGGVGTLVTLTGTGFTLSDNEVHFGPGGMKGVTTLRKVNGTLLTFNVPESVNGCDFTTGLPPCADKSYPVVPGDYALYIVNQNGKTNSVTFTVTSY